MNPTNRDKNKICLKSRTRLELSKLSTKRQRDSVQFHIFCFGLFIFSGFVWTLTVRGYDYTDGQLIRDDSFIRQTCVCECDLRKTK